MAEKHNEATDAGKGNVLSGLEKISESKPYKWFGLFEKLQAPFVFLGGFVVGLWSTPLTGAELWMIVAKSLIIAVMTCSCLGLGLIIAVVARNLLWWRSKGLNLLDWILGSVIGFFIGGMLISPSNEGHAVLFILTFMFGGGGFWLFVLLPTLHKLGVLNMNEPPPWSKPQS